MGNAEYMGGIAGKIYYVPIQPFLYNVLSLW